MACIHSRSLAAACLTALLWPCIGLGQAPKADPKAPATKAPAAKTDPALAAPRKRFLKGQYAEAIEGYTQAAESSPVAAAVGIARAKAAQGDYAGAEGVLSAAREKQPQAVAPVALLAQLVYQQGRLKEAGELVLAARKLDDNDIVSRWVQVQLARDQGELKRAEAELKWFIEYYNRREQSDQPITDCDELRAIGPAAGEYARWKRDSEQFRFLVNDLRAQQLELEPDYWPAMYEAGRLFLEKYNEAEAVKELKAALAKNPQAAEVYAALAELHIGRFDLDEAQSLAEQAAKINPKLPAAQRLLADVLLANFQVVEAAAALEKHALPLNPVSEETLGRLAACYVVLDGLSPQDAAGGTRFGKLAAQVAERNAACGTFYFALARALDSRRRYNDAVKFYQEATRRMPQLVGPQGALGMVYMRLGEEADGRKVLDAAFEADPFNVRTSNMLKVLEVLDKYETARSENFVVKFNPQHDKLLARYALRYLEAQYPALCEQFAFRVPQPSLFEIFSQAKNTNGHGWFSARLVGLPYIGTVGACAGKMVGIASPNESPYNWARVLKHEFIHVINLQQTNFNLPHWFAEGIATYNEGYPRPAEWNELLVERHSKGELFTLENVNFGFQRPRSGHDWSMAYCQSELYVEYMFSKFGPDSVAKLLAAFSGNRDTPAAIKEAFGITSAEFHQGFLVYVGKIVGELNARHEPPEAPFADLEKAAEAQPPNADALARLANACTSRKDHARARKLAKQALGLVPKHPLAGYVLARTSLVIGETDEAVKTLEEVLDRARPHENVLALLATLREQQQDLPQAIALNELGLKTDAENPRWMKSLARLALISKDNARARDMLGRLAGIDADNFTIRKKLAQLALAAEDWPQVIRWGEEALTINVMDAEVHRWLTQAYTARSEWKAAVFEHESLVELAAEDAAGLAPAKLALAQALVRAGDKARAKGLAAELREADPELEGLTELEQAVK